MTPVEVEPAGKDVGAGESLEAELCSVGAASNGHDGAEAACLFYCLLGDGRDVGLVAKLLQHVIVYLCMPLILDALTFRLSIFTCLRVNTAVT